MLMSGPTFTHLFKELRITGVLCARKYIWKWLHSHVNHILYLQPKHLEKNHMTTNITKHNCCNRNYIINFELQHQNPAQRKKLQ